jgi:hypothetical protein
MNDHPTVKIRLSATSTNWVGSSLEGVGESQGQYTTLRPQRSA